MSETSHSWLASPARHLTLGNYLPSADTPAEPQSIRADEFSRQDAALRLIELSGRELGRTSEERRLYLQTVGERYGHVQFLAHAEELRSLQNELTAQRIDLDTQDPVVKEAIKQDIVQLQAASERLFGAVDPERFEAIVARTRQKAASLLTDTAQSPAVTTAAKRVLATFPSANPALVESHIYKPRTELLEHWRPAVEAKYHDLLALVDHSRPAYSSEELAGLFRAAIRHMATDWQLANADSWTVAHGKTNINVDGERRTVWVPAEQSYSPERTAALLVHEIGGHLLRNLQGELSGNPLLATDMPGRSVDEEGLFVTLQQTLTGKTREAGIPYYLAVGLAKGTLGGQPVPLTDLLPYLLDYQTVMNGKELTTAQSESLAKNDFRVTRGMPSFVIDGQLYQATYNMDLKYAIGQQHAVEFLETHRHNPAALDDVMLGKFAYSNPVQTAYAAEHAATITSVPSAVR